MLTRCLDELRPSRGHEVPPLARHGSQTEGQLWRDDLFPCLSQWTAKGRRLFYIAAREGEGGGGGGGEGEEGGGGGGGGGEQSEINTRALTSGDVVLIPAGGQYKIRFRNIKGENAICLVVTNNKVVASSSTKILQ